MTSHKQQFALSQKLLKWFNLVTRNFSEDTSSEVTIEKHIAIWFNEKTTAVEIINNFKSKTKFEKKRITDYFFQPCA